MSFRRGATGQLAVAAMAITAVVTSAAGSDAAPQMAGVLSTEDCAGKSKGHIVRWYQLAAGPLATIPLRCGEKDGFGLLKILDDHPETEATLDQDISDTLVNYDHRQQQALTSVACSRSDLPPCPGHFRVVVQFRVTARPA